jgi:hypothetical protein
MPVFCLFTLGGHGNFTAEVTMEQTDLLCTALALNIELLSIRERRHIRMSFNFQFDGILNFATQTSKMLTKS